MNSIDERVVQMGFDNKQFESGAKQTMSTLEKLKASLNFDSSVKALRNLQLAGNAVSLNSISDSLEAVSQKFTAFGIIGVTALQNITNKAVDAGMALVKSLSIDQISAGWNKLEQKTANVQTIINATGKDIDEVNGYLNKLMWFSDETSYGFTDMTAALGQLTSSGADIDNIIPMIEGIANATAYAGKGAAEFSRTMYNLNQSYSTGALQFIDWKSLEQAGVASKELKQTFIDTAVELGKIKEGEVTVANFGSTLQKKWADTEVMEKAFGKFAEMTEAAYQLVSEGAAETASEAIEMLAGQYDDLAVKAFKSAQEAKSFTEAIDATKDAVSSGWLNTFEIIFGNYEQQKVLWTDLANELWDIFAGPINERNDILEEWSSQMLGGREDLIQGIWNIFHSIVDVVNTIREALQEVFPPMTAEKLVELTTKFKSFSETLKMSDETAEKVKNAFKGVFSVFDILKQAFDAISRVAAPILSEIKDTALDVAEAIGLHITDLSDRLEENDSIFNFLQNGIEKVKTAFKDLTGLDLHVPTFEELADVFERIKGVFEDVKDRVSTFIEGFERLTGVDLHVPTFEDFVSVLKTLKGIFEGIIETFKTVGEYVKVVVDAFLELIGIDLDAPAYEHFADIFNAIRDAFNGAKDGVSGFVEKFKEFTGIDFKLPTLEEFRDKVSEIKDKLEPFASFIGEIKDAIVDFFKKIIDGGILSKIGEGISNLLQILEPIFSGIIDLVNGLISGIGDALGNFSLGEGLDLANTGILTLILLGIKKFVDSINDMGLSEAVTKFTDALGGIGDALKSFKKKTDASALLKIAISIGVLAASIVVLGNIEPERLVSAATGLMVAIGGILLVANGLKKLDGVKFGKAGITILEISVAIDVLSSALNNLSDLNIGQITTGLIGVFGLITELGLLMKYAKFDNVDVGSGVGIVLIAEAIKIMAKTVGTLGNLDIPTLAKGLGAMAIALAEIAGFAAILGKVTGIGKSAASLLVISNALVILGAALRIMGGMSWEAFAKSMAALGGSLLILAGAMALMTGALPGAAALVVVSAALALLVPELLLLSMISWEGFAKGMATLAGTFTLIGVAGLLLGPITPLILAMAGALAAVGAAVAIAGAGLLAISAAMSAIAILGTASATAFVAGLNLIIDGITALVPKIALAAGEIIVGIVTGISKHVSELAKAATLIVTALLSAIKTMVPAIIDTGLTILVALLQGINDNLPAIITLALSIIVNFCLGITEGIPVVVNTGMYMIAEFLLSISDAIRNGLPMILAAAGTILSALIEFVLTAIQDIAEEIPGIGSKISEGLESAKGAVRDFFDVEEAEQMASDYAANIKKGLDDSVEDIKKSGSDVGSAAKEGVNNTLNGGIDIGQAFGLDVSAGLTGTTDEGKSSASFFGQELYNSFTAQLSPVNGESAGTAFGLGTASGVESTEGDVTDATELIGNSGLDSLKDVIEGSGSSDGALGLGELLGDDFAKGTSSKAGEATNAGTEVANASLSGIKSKNGEYQTAGYNTAAGFATGIRNGKSLAINAAIQLASESLTAVRTRLNMHSPSKEFEEIGELSDQGFANGLDKFTFVIRKSASNAAENALDSFLDPVSKISDLISDDIDLSPVIHPVLDLGEIQNGSRQIDSLLSGSSVTPQIIASSVRSGSNYDALNNRIEKLNSDIQRMKTERPDTQNITGASLAAAVKDALNGCAVVMDKRTVGRITTDYQRLTAKTAGA